MKTLFGAQVANALGIEDEELAVVMSPILRPSDPFEGEDQDEDEETSPGVHPADCLVHIVDAINLAKTFADLWSANVWYGYLLSVVFDDCHPDCYRIRQEAVWATETQTEDASDRHELYYDLLVVTDRASGKSACIPLPLLRERALRALIKVRPELVARRDHNRVLTPGEYVPPDGFEDLAAYAGQWVRLDDSLKRI